MISAIWESIAAVATVIAFGWLAWTVASVIEAIRIGRAR